MTPYLQLDRRQWSSLCTLVPTMLTESDIAQLRRISEELSFDEVTEIYLPLSHLLNFYYDFDLYRQTMLEQFLDISYRRTPYIISIAGSVAVGKSTIAHVLQILLSCYLKHRHIELIATDGFLYPNQVLKKRNLMKKKGFPQSYDINRLMKFLSDLKSGVSNLTAPVYSHLIYDVIPGGDKIVVQPDILILEGLNVLQNGSEYFSHSQRHVFISDFVDFSIYVDAPENLLKDWYINRFIKFREEKAFVDPNSYFYNCNYLTKEKLISVAASLWDEINYINLKENILPTRERANLILTKGQNHLVNQVQLRK